MVVIMVMMVVVVIATGVVILVLVLMVIMLDMTKVIKPMATVLAVVVVMMVDSGGDGCGERRGGLVCGAGCTGSGDGECTSSGRRVDDGKSIDGEGGNIGDESVGNNDIGGRGGG